MKTDLVTSISAAVLGVVVSFLIVNTLIPAIEPVSFKKLDEPDMTYTLAEPDEEVFNQKALNPTVEVYVGDCKEYDVYGNCIEPGNDDDKKDDTDEDESNPLEPDQEN